MYRVKRRMPRTEPWKHLMRGEQWGITIIDTDEMVSVNETGFEPGKDGAGDITRTHTRTHTHTHTHAG